MNNDNALTLAGSREVQHIEAARDLLRGNLDRASAALGTVAGLGSGPLGLTPDSVKQSPEYREAKANYDEAFARLRWFNGQHKPAKRTRTAQEGR